MDTNHNVNVTYQSKTPLSSNKAFQVIVGVVTLAVLFKLFWQSAFSTVAFELVGYPQPKGEGFGSVALIGLIIDTFALIGLASLTVYRLLWSVIVGIHEYWVVAVAKGKAMAEGNQNAAAIGVAAAMANVANDVASAVSSSVKPRRTVDERLAILNSNDKEFKKLIDDHESRLAAVEITVGLRDKPEPPPLSVEEQLALVQAELAAIKKAKAEEPEPTKTTRSRGAK
jgi:hypothetical protein